MSRAAFVLSSLSLASASSQWVLDSSSQAQQIVGVGAWTQGNDIAAASANGVGGFMERWNGGTWSHEMLGDAAAGILMDAATSDKVSVGVSMMPVVISTDGGQTYVISETVAGLSQNANVFPPDSGDQIGLVGSFSTTKGSPFVSGVAHSSDLGASWSVSEIPDGYVRYGAFPSSNTWFVTAGMWADSESTDKKSNDFHHMSSRVSVDRNSGKFDLFKGNTTAAHSQDESGWWGKIWKTTDAGQTWTNVFSSGATDTYYFNNIACASENLCVAVTEGDAVSDFRAYWTQDGGETWVDSLPTSAKPDNQVSLMGAGWFNEQEGWLAGAAKSGRDLVGLFYQTLDGGKSYSLAQELTNCFPIDMDMTKVGANMGVAACMSSSGTSASVASLQ